MFKCCEFQQISTRLLEVLKTVLHQEESISFILTDVFPKGLLHCFILWICRSTERICPIYFIQNILSKQKSGKLICLYMIHVPTWGAFTTHLWHSQLMCLLWPNLLCRCLKYFLFMIYFYLYVILCFVPTFIVLSAVHSKLIALYENTIHCDLLWQNSELLCATNVWFTCTIAGINMTNIPYMNSTMQPTLNGEQVLIEVQLLHLTISYPWVSYVNFHYIKHKT